MERLAAAAAERAREEREAREAEELRKAEEQQRKREQLDKHRHAMLDGLLGDDTDAPGTDSLFGGGAPKRAPGGLFD